MALTEFELIMLDNGEVALQRSGSDKALVRIKFSGEVLDYLGGKHLSRGCQKYDGCGTPGGF